MKKVTFVLLALAISFGIVQAQETTTPPKEQGRHQRNDQGYHGKPGIRHRDGAMYYKRLNLTADQQQQMKSINEAYHSKMSDLRKQEAAISVKEYKEQMRTMGKERHEKLQAILTPDQKQQLATMKADARKRFEGRAANRMANLKKNLQLTDDQSAKIQALRADTKSKIKSIRENQLLTDDQKKEEVVTALKKQHEEMNGVLTADQMKKMKEMRSRHTHQTAK